MRKAWTRNGVFRNGSMKVIAHTAALSPDGSVQPSRIDTGSAGLVEAPVTPFADGVGGGPTATWTALGVLALLVALATGATGLRRRRQVTPPSNLSG